MLHPYRVLFAHPHVLALLLWSLVARLHIAGLPIPVTFLVAEWTGSYAWAGLVVGGHTLGTAIAGPLRGRMVDVGRADRMMLLCGLCFGTGLSVLALLPESVWWISVPLSITTGLFTPPSNQIARASWPRLTTGSSRQTIFAAEGALQELIFVVGPLLAAAAVALAGPRPAVGMLAVIVVIGALGFTAVVRRADLVHAPTPTPESAHTAHQPLLTRPMVVLSLLALLLVAGIGAIDLAIVAFARELGAAGYAGGFAAIWALGSLVGGFVAGTLVGTPRIGIRALATTCGLALLVPLSPPLLELPSPWLLTPVLFVAGLAIAPTLAAGMSRLGEIAPQHRRAEAFGWLNTATATGISVAAPLTGALLDWGGVAAGFACGAVLTLGATILGFLAPSAPRPESAGPTTAGEPSSARPDGD
ncbi:MFS transporter [Lipingzhangella sp. LS1_29]|uniref:MFS transporter n=1 Tax=Lipingzhangella rawalii TaxID=2055835 RepID=A0ABU2H711_9ACTN|nr:MFS transporter [Lipingzhangella rawalii]MDS1271091.1 MFS transporter [Lipingzhangella rawalii]